MTVELMNGPALKKKLLALPSAEWSSTGDYGWWDALLIVPAPWRHDSGYAHIAVIGVRENAAHAILAQPDDLQLPANESILPGRFYGHLRMDAYWPSGVLRLWSREVEFSISSPVSSVEILTRKREK